ncbi:OsmC family protein [Fusibacter sp. 3D3]|uniref:OsmC family protein n=1 Tax=Fusibacter sp. 3D3 TaxID=1048380 RepID=UPI000852FF89|nr:OsmC family protein [Fusibacter sp. 3D3]
MENQLKVKIERINDGVKFKSTVDGKPEITTDYIPPYGDGMSMLPLELFLISLGTCIGGAVCPLLRKMHKSVDDMEIHVSGVRKTEHPTGFSTINVCIQLQSSDATLEDLKKVLAYAEGICPVWSMLDKEIKLSFDLSVSDLNHQEGGKTNG